MRIVRMVRLGEMMIFNEEKDEKKKPDIARSEGVVEEPRPKGARLPWDAATERPR